MKVFNLQTLWKFEGFIISSIIFNEFSVNVSIRLDHRKTLCCPFCGRRMWKNKTIVRTVNDLPIGIFNVVLIRIETVQGKCPCCKHSKTFFPEEIAENATATRRLQRFAFELCRYMSPAEVASLLPYSDDTIRRWDMNILQEEFGKVKLNNISHILIDEKSIGKNHHYVTLVLNAKTSELLYLGEGKGYDSLKPFFEGMTQKQRENIKIACMDRNASYPKAVNEFCPYAEIVLDKFHIVKNVNDAVDKTRREETTKALKEKRPIIKGKRYLLLRSRDSLSTYQYESLNELLSLNETINRAYIQKESFGRFWLFMRPSVAIKFLKNWKDECLKHGLKHLAKVAIGLLENIPNLISTLNFSYTNAAMERFNVVVSKIIRRGYGYKNLTYLFLKLRQQSIKTQGFFSAMLR